MDWLKRVFGVGRLTGEPKGQNAGRVLAPASTQRTQLGLKEVDLPRGVVTLRSGEVRCFLKVTGFSAHQRSREDAAAWLQGYARALNTLPGNAVFPEGVAYDAASGNFYVSSTGDGSIMRGNINGTAAEVWLPGGHDGHTFATGMKVDAQGRLYVSGGSTGLMSIYDTNTKALLAQFKTGADLTLSGDLVGTLRYMSPEQAAGHGALVDARADVYGLGVTLYELLTLRPAFDGPDREGLLRQVVWDDPPAPRRVRNIRW